eukprot:1010188_1
MNSKFVDVHSGSEFRSAQRMSEIVVRTTRAQVEFKFFRFSHELAPITLSRMVVAHILLAHITPARRIELARIALVILVVSTLKCCSTTHARASKSACSPCTRMWRAIRTVDTPWPPCVRHSKSQSFMGNQKSQNVRPNTPLSPDQRAPQIVSQSRTAQSESDHVRTSYLLHIEVRRVVCALPDDRKKLA